MVIAQQPGRSGTARRFADSYPKPRGLPLLSALSCPEPCPSDGHHYFAGGTSARTRGTPDLALTYTPVTLGTEKGTERTFCFSYAFHIPG
jgi:hypothetical protein